MGLSLSSLKYLSPAYYINEGLKQAGIGDLTDMGMNQDDQTVNARNQLIALAQGGAPKPQQAGLDTQTLNNYQIPLANRLNALSEGRGPSAAQMQMQDAMSRAAASQQSLARGASGRGVGAGAAFRQAANQTAAMQSQGARDLGLMRVQEQLGANQLLGGVAQGMRQSTEGSNQFNAAEANRLKMQDKLSRIQALSAAAGSGTQSPGLGMQALGFLGGLFGAGA